MKRIQILVDSTADLSKELREQYDINYVPMNFVWQDREYVASLDWEEITSHEFYEIMRNGSRITTTQVPREQYEKAFTQAAENGDDTIYVSCSSALSGSVKLAGIVAKELKDKYPDTEIACIDSLCSSFGQGMMAIMASKMRDSGHSFDEIVNVIENNKLKVNQFGTVESLEHLRRAGRIKATKAFFGNLFGVKPIIISDAIGQNYAIKKVKGAQNAKEEIARLIAEAVENPEQQTLFVSHADARADADALVSIIQKNVPFCDVTLGVIGPIVGASVGPGTIIAYCFGKEVTIEGKE